MMLSLFCLRNGVLLCLFDPHGKIMKVRDNMSEIINENEQPVSVMPDRAKEIVGIIR